MGVRDGRLSLVVSPDLRVHRENSSRQHSLGRVAGVLRREERASG